MNILSQISIFYKIVLLIVLGAGALFVGTGIGIAVAMRGTWSLGDVNDNAIIPRAAVIELDDDTEWVFNSALHILSGFAAHGEVQSETIERAKRIDDTLASLTAPVFSQPVISDHIKEIKASWREIELVLPQLQAAYNEQNDDAVRALVETHIIEPHRNIRERLAQLRRLTQEHSFLRIFPDNKRSCPRRESFDTIALSCFAIFFIIANCIQPVNPSKTHSTSFFSIAVFSISFRIDR
ncbi:hypothetical protein FACS1894103_6020 [Campylobacterota bacterium]|nr:hypothetical protein FACS1894103_6020 [Campylobacterota bacterium]